MQSSSSSFPMSVPGEREGTGKAVEEAGRVQWREPCSGAREGDLQVKRNLYKQQESGVRSALAGKAAEKAEKSQRVYQARSPHP